MILDADEAGRPALEFPKDVVRETAREMQRGADCAISHFSYEASAAVLIAGLRRNGWRVDAPLETALQRQAN